MANLDYGLESSDLISLKITGPLENSGKMFDFDRFFTWLRYECNHPILQSYKCTININKQ